MGEIADATCIFDPEMRTVSQLRFDKGDENSVGSPFLMPIESNDGYEFRNCQGTEFRKAYSYVTSSLSHSIQVPLGEHLADPYLIKFIYELPTWVKELLKKNKDLRFY